MEKLEMKWSLKNSGYLKSKKGGCGGGGSGQCMYVWVCVCRDEKMEKEHSRKIIVERHGLQSSCHNLAIGNV